MTPTQSTTVLVGGDHHRGCRSSSVCCGSMGTKRMLWNVLVWCWSALLLWMSKLSTVVGSFWVPLQVPTSHYPSPFVPRPFSGKALEDHDEFHWSWTSRQDFNINKRRMQNWVSWLSVKRPSLDPSSLADPSFWRDKPEDPSDGKDTFSCRNTSATTLSTHKRTISIP